jgi:hypothetical protein
MLSKMARPVSQTYKDILKIDLSKSKLPELKQYAKDLNIKVSGNKGEVKDRIEQQIKKEVSAVTIQKTFRRQMVSKWMKLKGTRENCVNETDFYTLEPLNEIPYLNFIKYTDASHNFNYGFDIKSLCTMATKNKKFENPYNRENMKVPFGINLVKVVKLTNILFPGNDMFNDIATMYESSNMFVDNQVQQTSEQAFFAHYEGLQQMPIEQRITGLFIHIDSLGNYSNREWLSQLNEDRLYYLILKINQFWHRIPHSLRNRICPYISPFSPEVFGIGNVHITIQIVVKIAEILVYSGLDDEHKQLGAMYFLSGLTLFSTNARNQLPWLYENYFSIVHQ